MASVEEISGTAPKTEARDALTKPSEKTQRAEMAWNSMPIPNILMFWTVMIKSQTK